MQMAAVAMQAMERGVIGSELRESPRYCGASGMLDARFTNQ
jgi:hypothetical protein